MYPAPSSHVWPPTMNNALTVTWLLDRHVHFRSLLMWGYPEATQHCHFSLGSGETSITKSDRLDRQRWPPVWHGIWARAGQQLPHQWVSRIHGHGRNKKPHRSLEVPLTAPSYLWCLQLAANLELYVLFSGKKYHPILNACMENAHSSFPLLLGLPLISHQYLMSRS